MAIPKLQAYALPTALDVPMNRVDWASDPECATLLIRDMQDYFIGFWGSNYPMMEQVVVNVAVLHWHCKEHNIPMHYTAQLKEQSDEDRTLFNDMWGPGLTCSPEQQKIVEALVPDEADTTLVKWRYNALHRSPLEQMLKETGRGQLIIIGAHVHIDYMTTATDAFIRGIKPFMVAGVLTDSSRDEHLMSLKYVAGHSGHVVVTQKLSPAPVPTSKDALRSVILPLLDRPEEPMDGENLIDYGLGSVRTMALAVRWCKIHGDIDFVMLVKKPIIDIWWVLLSREAK